MNSREIHYKVPWRARSTYPGHHLSQQKGAGLQFRNHVALIDAPDPRRFDVHASLRDPFEQIRVRVYQQTSSIPIYIVADLSASMAFVGDDSKIETLADFIECLSYSAYRTGDKFGFVGCADKHTEPLVTTATLNQVTGFELAQELRQRTALGKNSNGFLGAADLLGSRRALVFLVSDFHLPSSLLEKILQTLAFHDVVPVILWDRKEYEDLPNFGIARVVDRETNKSRLLFMRPGLKNRIQKAFADRREALFTLFRQYGRMPLLLQDGFNPDEITRYFFE